MSLNAKKLDEVGQCPRLASLFPKSRRVPRPLVSLRRGGDCAGCLLSRSKMAVPIGRELRVGQQRLGLGGCRLRLPGNFLLVALRLQLEYRRFHPAFPAQTCLLPSPSGLQVIGESEVWPDSPQIH